MAFHAAVSQRGMFVVGHDHADRFHLLRKRRLGNDIELVNRIVARSAGACRGDAGGMGVFIRKGNRIENLVPKSLQVAPGTVQMAIDAGDLFAGVRGAFVDGGDGRIGMAIKASIAAEGSGEYAQQDGCCNKNF